MPERMEDPCPKCILQSGCSKKNCATLAQFKIEQKMDVLVDLSEVEHVEGLQDAMGRASIHVEARLAADPEYTRKHTWHIHNIVAGIAVGILQADPWYVGYRVPPNYELVVNKFAEAIQADPPGELWNGEVFEALSLLDIREWVKKTAMVIPEFVAWNETDGPEVVFTSRYSDTPTKRGFIDLDAVFQCVMCVLRNRARDDDRFDAAFEKEYGKPA